MNLTTAALSIQAINEQTSLNCLFAENRLPHYLSVCFQELFPANKRSCEHFSKYFTDAGLKELSDFAKNQQSIGARKELQKELQEQMSRGDPLKDVGIRVLVSFTLSPLLYAQGEDST